MFPDVSRRYLSGNSWALERSGINQRKRKAKKIKKYAIPRITVKKS